MVGMIQLIFVEREHFQNLLIKKYKIFEITLLRIELGHYYSYSNKPIDNDIKVRIIIKDFQTDKAQLKENDPIKMKRINL